MIRTLIEHCGEGGLRVPWRDAEKMMDVCPEKVKERTENENI